MQVQNLHLESLRTLCVVFSLAQTDVKLGLKACILFYIKYQNLGNAEKCVRIYIKFMGMI